MANRFAKYSLTGGLTKDEIYRIYDEALEILEKIGVECTHEKILSRLSGFNGLIVERNRVRVKKDFADSLVKKFRDKMKAIRDENEKKEKPGSFSLCPAYHGFYVLDYDSDQPRKATMADLRNALKLQDSMGMRGMTAPLVPHDVPVKLQRLAMFKASAENSIGMGGHAKGAVSVEEAELLCEMGEASGRKPPYVHLQFYISPLKYDHALLDIGCHFLEKGKGDLVAVWGGPMPCAGSTAPLFVPGAFVQMISETISSEILTSLVFGGEFWPGICPWIFDMQYGSFIFGSPENSLFRLTASQLSEELFGMGRGGGFLGTNSSGVDEQAAVERAFNVILGALDGATAFGGAGLISQDMVFSPEQMIIDQEIVDWAHRFISGLEINEEKGLTLDTLKEVGPGGNFLAHESTVGNLRKFFWNPRLFDRMAVGQWMAQGSVSLRERAHKIVEEKIKSHKFELDSATLKRMDDVYKKGEKVLLK